MKKILALAAIALGMAMCSGCYFSDYRSHELDTVSIPAGNNLDSITIKDGRVTDLKYHERQYWERSNCPVTLPVYKIQEKPWD